MKKAPLALAVAMGIVITGCVKKEQAAPEAAEVKLETQEQKVSYIIAEDMARRLKMQDITLDPKIALLALEDVAADRDSRLSDEEKQETLMSFQKDMQAKQQELMAEREAEFKASGEKNLAEGKAFLEENAKKEGVVSLDSGVQYKVVREGEGPKPTAESVVEVDYRGTLIDGTEFDSSYSRGQRAQFPVGSVIPGWTEILQLMPEGSKWEVFIPSEHAYGPGGAGGQIGPNATLQFEIELHKSNVEQKAEEGDAEQGAQENHEGHNH
ncbi:FKBP-type peptidyl-prolyl cis-trans isomerase [Biformimicrobium ophioploci]|uniref:Peptidyl-prolyl cis-trans isomerase n=1 Tax=Biformimicrobium ophioploci TaxID=3036711 RepID=A0ABQ6LVT6_9GAMM|nr:FKBP-type peptidyl-prolyl cis-trans isomerase [Microbulbifer sp. NKW57]GMG86194.1 macrophage infectivity potentiator Mip [Microbulbifer sp. NKW57]